MDPRTPDDNHLNRSEIGPYTETLRPTERSRLAAVGLGMWLAHRLKHSDPISNTEFVSYGIFADERGLPRLERTLWWRAVSDLCGPSVLVRTPEGIRRMRLLECPAPAPGEPTDRPDETVFRDDPRILREVPRG